jgi:hypothetical protein
LKLVSAFVGGKHAVEVAVDRRGAPARSVVDSPVSRIGAPLSIAGDVGRSRQSEPDALRKRVEGGLVVMSEPTQSEPGGTSAR